MRALASSLIALSISGCFFGKDTPKPPAATESNVEQKNIGETQEKKEIEEPPTPKPADVDQHRLSAGNERVCLTKGGRGYCLGTNEHGELGDGTKDARGSATEPAKGQFKDVWHIAASDNGHSCLLDGGKAYCWGEFTEPDAPTRRTAVKGATWMSGGGEDYCFVHDGGKVHCVGRRAEDSYSVKGIENAARVYVSASTMGRQACAVLTTGKVSCWGGENQNGSLGRGFAGPPPSGPTLSEAAEVQGLEDVSIVTGYDNSWCAVKKNGELWCWGENEFDIFGVDSDKTKQSLAPMKVAIPEVVDVAINGTALCATQKKGTINCFGFGSNDIFPTASKQYPKAGKLWPGAKLDSPTEVVTASHSMLCFLGAGDKVSCFGENSDLGVSKGAPKEYQF